MHRFKDRTALVTGAARGIGRAITEAFAAEGAHVGALDSDAEALRQLADGVRGTTPLACDLRDRAGVDRAVEAIASLRGGVDILVNNAAVFPRRIPFLEQSAADWEAVLQVNVMGTFHVTQAVARIMAGAGKGGRIVNISSVNAGRYRAGAAGVTQYGASKAALDNMTRGWAVELAPHRIVVNGAAFGFVRTPMASGDGLESPEFKRDYLDSGRIPLGRVNEAVDCANLVLFLASDQCTGMTGETVVQDGGLGAVF